MKIYDYLFPPRKLKLDNGKEILEFSSRIPFIVTLFVIAILISVKVTGFNFETLIERGNNFFSIIKNMFPPRWDYLNKIWNPLFDTIKMSLLGSVIGSVLVIPFSIIASSNIVKNKIILSITRLFLSILRTLPTLVIALIATYIFGLGTFAGTVAISIFTFAYVGKKLYEQIETVDMGAYEALQALGANKFKSFFGAIIPQVLPAYLSTCLFCFEGNVRHAAILGYVGAGGLGLILNENLAWREYDSVGMILLALFLTVVIIEMLSYYIRKKLT